MDGAELAARFGEFPRPPCSAHLGMEYVGFDPALKQVEVTFQGKAEFCNPRGHVQGGFIAAMLDDAMAIGLILTAQGKFTPPTLELKVSYFAPALPGLLKAQGRVLRLGRAITFLEGDLFAPDGTHLARASATAKLLAVG
jgi:uncharacterized protein (TIGR00369 family)